MLPRMTLRPLTRGLLCALVVVAPAAFAQDDDDEWGDEEEAAVVEGAAEPAAPPPVGEEEEAPPPANEVEPAPAIDEPRPPPATSGSVGRAEEPEPPVAGGRDDDDLLIEDEGGRLVGDPVPLTQREPLLPQLGVEVGLRYGLVGSGPTRFVNDIRFGAFDWLELRTSLAPYPSSLMARVALGRQQGPFGALLVEGGLAHFDAGLRLIEDAGEPEVGIRMHWEGSVAYTRAFLDRFALYSAARYRYRQSFLSDDDQHAFALEGAVTYDLLPWVALTGGVAYAQAVGTPIREIAVNFVEVDRPGMSHFLVRDDGLSQSLTVPLALTYGRVESFDVDLFITPRVYPQLDVVFGAGVRWRTWFGRKPWEPRG